MSTLTPKEQDRLMELLADEALQQLGSENFAELAELRSRAGDEVPLTGEALGTMLLAMDAADQAAGSGSQTMPPALRNRLAAQGRGLIGGASALPQQTVVRRSGLPFGLAAAVLAVAATLAGSWWVVQNRERELEQAQSTIAMLEAKVQDNAMVLARAESSLQELRTRISESEGIISDQEIAIAEAQAREIELATRLARATEDLSQAELRIAYYETPVDPETLAANRTKLLEVPGTIQLAWSPFDLPDAPAEQQMVRGDVVWNDQEQIGYLRFVGLNPNDPDIEQYQVWIIDERGLEQKVSGGIFNANAEGEIIVQITPGIDVGRVALFAVTVENPGGTWVPDLKRRVVIAPRDG